MDLINLSLEVIQGLQYLSVSVCAAMLMVEAGIWPLSTTSTMRVIIVCGTTLASAPFIF